MVYAACSKSNIFFVSCCRGYSSAVCGFSHLWSISFVFFFPGRHLYTRHSNILLFGCFKYLYLIAIQYYLCLLSKVLRNFMLAYEM